MGLVSPESCEKRSVVSQALSDMNYILNNPESRSKTPLSHINMLKPYHNRETHTWQSSLTMPGQLCYGPGPAVCF